MQLKNVKSDHCLQYDLTKTSPYGGKFRTCATSSILNQKWVGKDSFLVGLNGGYGWILAAPRVEMFKDALVVEYVENPRYNTVYYVFDPKLQKRAVTYPINLRTLSPSTSFYSLFPSYSFL